MTGAQLLESPPNAAVENKDYYRPDIDGLRGIAVGLVILYHLFPAIFKNGYLGVDVFFVISGFVVTQALERDLRHGPLNGLKRFYGRRIKRILPALYLNIVVAIILSCLLIPPSELRSIFKTAAAAVMGASNVALLYARFDYFSPDLSLNPFVQTWSLGIEEQFYLFFPSLLLAGVSLAAARRRFKIDRLLVILAGLSLFYWGCLQSSAPVAAFYNPLARFWELLTGVILARKKDAIARMLGAEASVRLRSLAAACLVIALALPADRFYLGSLANVLTVLASALVLAAGVNSASVNAALGFRPLVWAGKLSYSLYLWHYCTFTFMRQTVGESPSHAVVALLVTFAVSYCSYRFVEIPFRYSSRKDSKVIVFGLAGAAAAVVFVGALYRLPPSRIYLGHAERYADLWSSDDVPLARSLAASQRECHLEYKDHLSPGLFDRCSTARKSNFIYLVGNSHAQHLIPMLEQASEHSGYGYSALTISNCRLISAFQLIASINYRYDLCKDYFDQSLDVIRRTARQGDIVLLGARSLLDKPAPSEGGNPSNAYVGGRRLSADEAYAKSIADLVAFSRSMRSRGVRLVFAGPTPAFDQPATLCSPEWFRPERKGCKTAIEAVLLEKNVYLSSISEIAAKSGNAYFWDPLPALCDGDYCYPAKGGRLLYRDKHHLSLYGARSLAPGFAKFVKNAGKNS